MTAPRIESLAERVEFIFEHWTARCRATEISDAVLTRLDRGRQLARALASQNRGRVLLHGDLHPGNVLDGGPRGLIAIDPRPCTGDPAFDALDWVFWKADPDHWHTRSHELATGLGIASERVWQWCSAFAALLAAIKIARGAALGEVEALLDLAA